MTSFRIVFFGTPELAVPSLARVAERYGVCAVVCQPDRPQGRSGKPAPPPTKAWALERGIAVHQPTALNDGTFEAWLREQAPDVCALVAYGRILKQPLLDVPKHGFLNMHPSLLPRHRGPSPIQTAILCGDAVTGVSIMRLDAGMDTGDVLLQQEVAIEPDDTTASLSARLADLGADMLAEGIGLVESGQAVFAPQDSSRATVTRLYAKHDGQIRWDAAARDIRNLVRAAVPWPVAHCRFRNDVCRILKTEIISEPPQAAPGTVERVERDRIVVAASDARIAIIEIQMPGKRPMPVAEFLRGHAVAAGERFEDL